MAIFVKLFVLISSFVLIFPASSLAQQTTPDPEATVLPKTPVQLIEDNSQNLALNPLEFEVSISEPLLIENTETRSKSNHRITKFTDCVKAKNTVEGSVVLPGYFSIDSTRRKN
ncbi:MAG: hypothetical protein KDD63_14440 [Bacteroidetes bacterium]|nr:hypothetical protein [Bacteroidota bacterium]MCB0853420.1 hypothetical protein [Bacteroidota bacterium]